MSLLSKLIFKTRKKSQMIIAIIGAIIGVLTMIATVQYYVDYKALATSGDDLVKNGFEVQKKVSGLSALNVGSSDFSDEDIQQLKDLNFVKDIAPIQSNMFTVFASLGGEGSRIPKFSLLLFFESVPDKYIKGENENFEWNQGDTIIPIIIPAEYLNLFNYGFAPSQQGVPQISEEMLSSLYMNLECKGNGRVNVFKGQIVGFTAKINSIMVPHNFLTWANQHYGEPTREQPVNRVFISADPAYHHEFVDLIEKRGYIVNETKLQASESSAQLQLTISILLFLGSIIIIQSIMNFVQYSQILINEGSYEIGVLTNIGYDFETLSSVYNKYFTRVFVLITLIALAIGTGGKWYVNHLFSSRGFELTGNLSWMTYVIAIVFLVACTVISRIVIKRTIKKMAEKN